MDTKFILLFYLCSLSGLIMVVGGIWLIYKEKIYIDKESKQVTEIETPIGKFKTNIPALVLFALGFVPLIYPIVKISEFSKEISKQVRIVGNVKSNVHPVQVYAVLEADSLMQDRVFSLVVPNLSKDYKIVYIAKDVVFEDLAEFQNKKGEEIKLPAKEMTIESSQNFESNVPPVPSEFR